MHLCCSIHKRHQSNCLPKDFKETPKGQQSNGVPKDSRFISKTKKQFAKHMSMYRASIVHELSFTSVCQPFSATNQKGDNNNFTLHLLNLWVAQTRPPHPRGDNKRDNISALKMLHQKSIHIVGVALGLVLILACLLLRCTAVALAHFSSHPFHSQGAAFVPRRRGQGIHNLAPPYKTGCLLRFGLIVAHALPFPLPFPFPLPLPPSLPPFPPGPAASPLAPLPFPLARSLWASVLSR